MWAWISRTWSKATEWAASLSDPTDKTTEIRLIGYGVVVFMSCIWLSVGLHLNPHGIDTAWTNAFLGLCGLVSLGAFTIPKS